MANTKWKNYAINLVITGLMVASLVYDIEAVENLAWFVMLLIGFLMMIVACLSKDELLVKADGAKNTPGLWIFFVLNIALAAALGWFFTAFWYGFWWVLLRARIEAAKQSLSKGSNQ